MKNNKKYVRRLQLQFVLVVLGKHAREMKMKSAKWHSNFSYNQISQDINIRIYENGFSIRAFFSRNLIMFLYLVHVIFVISTKNTLDISK